MSPMAMAIKASKNLQKTERKRKGKKKKRRESDATTIQNCYFRLKSGSPG